MTPDEWETTRQELIELAAVDALGLAGDRERARLDRALESAPADIRDELRITRENVMKQVEEMLPQSEPSPSLKHRVLGQILQLIERDYDGSVQRSKWFGGRSDSGIDRQDWVERLVAGRVSPVWRVAALILATVSISMLFWIVSAGRTNRDLLQLARGFENRELFEKRVGPETLAFLLDPGCARIGLHPMDITSESRGLVSYFSETHDALLLATGLDERDKEYQIYLNADGVDRLLITFRSAGDIVAIDFDIPDDLSPLGASWWVATVDESGETTRILETLS